MSLVNGIAMLARARARGYAVGAFDVINPEFLAGAMEGVTAARAPVLLSLAEMHLDYVDREGFAPALRRAAETAPAPLTVHLDHGSRLDTLARALAAGFTSVMFDGSRLPYAENLRLTREAVRRAHAAGAALEAELGQVCGHEEATGEPGPGSRDPAPGYTGPAQAADFVRQTGCDFLAVSIGTVHGLHRQQVRLDLPRPGAGAGAVSGAWRFGTVRPRVRRPHHRGHQQD